MVTLIIAKLKHGAIKCGKWNGSFAYTLRFLYTTKQLNKNYTLIL